MLKKLLHRLSQPPGVFPWRLFFDKRNPLYQHHAQALWHVPSDKNKIVFRALYLLQYASWYLFYAWRESLRATKYIKSRTERGNPDLTTSQKVHIYKFIWIYTIPLRSIIRYRLIDQPENVLHHIYPHEIPKWQYALSSTITKDEHQFIGDKSIFAEKCKHLLIPAIQTLAYIEQGQFDKAHIDFFKKSKSVFLKPTNRNRSVGCYQLTNTEESVNLREVNKAKEHTDWTEIEMELSSSNQKHDFIVQPFLKNIREWKDLSNSSELITIRAISEHYKNEQRILSAVLEIPIEDGGKYYDIIPIQNITGKIHHHLFRTPKKGLNDRQKQLMEKLQGRSIPFWSQLCKYIFKAHDVCPNIRTIGWDIAITDEGPVLIEGNLGWGTHSLTMNPLGTPLQDIKI